MASVSSVSLGFYSVRIKNLEKDEYINTDEKISNLSFFQVLEKSLDGLLENPANDLNNKKVSWVEKDTYIKNADNGIIAGVLKSGEYRYESDLYDTETLTSQTKSSNVANAHPFYFLVKVPKKRPKGILCLQRFKAYGVKCALEQHLNDCFESSYENYRVELNPLVPKELIQKDLSEGSVKKIRLIKTKTPSPNVEDRVSGRSSIQEEGFRADFSFCPISRGGALNALKNSIAAIVRHAQSNSFRSLEGLAEFNEVKEMFEVTGLNFSNIKVEISNNNKIRTLDVSDLNKYNAYYDIGDLIEINPTSHHPVFDSINKVALEHLNQNILQSLDYTEEITSNV